MLKTWLNVRDAVGARLRPHGFLRVTPETFKLKFNDDCNVHVTIDRSRAKNLPHWDLRVSIGVSYPTVMPVYERLWGMEHEPWCDNFCPISVNLWQVSSRYDPTTPPRVDAENPERQLDALEAAIVRDASLEVAEVASLGGLADALGSRESRWYSAVSHRDFLPAVLIAIGRKDAAIELIDASLEEILRHNTDAEFVQSYAAFASRVRDFETFA